MDAFRATLEEVSQAQLLLQVVDASSKDKHLHMEQVNVVLEEIGADNVPQLQVFNKIDLIDEAPRIDYDENGAPRRVWLSAVTGAGIDLLHQVDDLLQPPVRVAQAMTPVMLPVQ